MRLKFDKVFNCLTNFQTILERPSRFSDVQASYRRFLDWRTVLDDLARSKNNQIFYSPLSNLTIICGLLFPYRDGEEWNRVRKALASKMLRPKDIRDNLENFNGVTRDAIEHMLSVRGADDVIPNLEEELGKWATECT